MATIATLSTARLADRPRWPAIVFAPLFLGCAVFTGLTGLAANLLRDPDSHWHVALGARIWRDRAVPWTDDYSHTLAGAPWIAKEWLAQLLLFGTHSALGWGGVVVLAAAILATTLALLFGWLRTRLRGSFALAASLLAFMFLAPHALARPLVFGLLALLAWTIGLADARRREQAPSLWCLLVLALWANLHASFTIAFPVLGVLAAEAVSDAPRERRLATLRDWGIFSLLSLLAGVATPYGLAAWHVTSILLGRGEAMILVREWQPLTLDAVGLLMVTSAVGLVGALAAEPRRNVWRIVAVVGLAAMTLRHSRFIDAYALVAPILAAEPLARRFATLRPEPPGARSPPLLSWAAVAALAGVGLIVVAIRPPQPDPSTTPRAALAAARQAGARGPIYNSYDLGGFLIAEGVPTFIDGRTELYLGGLIEEMDRAIRAERPDEFAALLDRYATRWALVVTGAPDDVHLAASSSWRRVYTDESASVYLRSDPPES